MLNNKLVAAEIIHHRVRVPKTFFVKNKHRLFSYEQPDALSSTEQVLTVLRREGSLFMKPIGSGRGQGVARLDYEADSYLIDRRPASVADIDALFAASDGWFLSESVEQHPMLSRIYPHTTNTIRLITVRDPRSGELSPMFAVLRIGTSETVPVDNGSRGGLVSKIDVDSGKLSEARTLWNHDVYECHPDSGEPIQGTALPEWPAMLKEVLAAAREMPYLQFVAWDILLTSEGPCVIEANTSSGVNIIQIWGPQRNAELGEFYRAHGVIA
nr:sugar-transfer associated ATP-grasp domain-containing protein [Leucobacter chinensis]